MDTAKSTSSLKAMSKLLLRLHSKLRTVVLNQGDAEPGGAKKICQRCCNTSTTSARWNCSACLYFQEAHQSQTEKWL